MQWRRKRRVLYVIGSAHHALLIKQYREDGGAGSGNDEERDSPSPSNGGGSYARAAYSQRGGSRGGGKTRGGGGYQSYYKYGGGRAFQQSQDSQPLVTTERRTFNEEEYTKITTPRQDVLFKKGYLGRKRPTPTVDPASTPGSEAGTGPTSGTDVVNGSLQADGEPLDSETSYEVLGPEDPPQFIYTNGFVDQNGLYFINGGSYELYDPYSGNVTVVVGPAPPYPGGGGPPPVLAAVPCNPLPLQPLEWFNPAFLSCVAAPCQPQCMGPPRGKRYSLDSQNCSPQSSESTGSPQEGEEAPMQFHPQAPPPYVYPGYMFGPPVYNMNGVTIQGAPPQVPPPPPSTDDASVAASAAKRRKKKRRRRRRRGGAEDGSEESSSEEQIEEPRSLTSQGSSLQELDVSPVNCSTTATSNHHQTIISSSVEGTEDKSTSSSFSSSPPPPPPEQEELPSTHRDDTVHVVLVNGDLGPPLSDESTQTASLSSLSSSDGLEKNPNPHPDELRVIPLEKSKETPSSEILVNGFHSYLGKEDNVDGKTGRQQSSRTTPSKDLHPSPSSLIEALNNAENKDRAVTKDIPGLQAKQGITKPESKNLCNGSVKQTVRNRKENRQKTNGSVNGTKLKTTGKMERNEPSAGGRNKGPPDQNVKQPNRPSTESSTNPDSSPREAKERAPRIPHDLAPGPRAHKVAEAPQLPHDKRGAKPARKERPNRKSPPNQPPAVPETAPLDPPDITSLSLRPEPPKNPKSPSYETSKPLKEISQKSPPIDDNSLKSLTEVKTPLTKESIKTPSVEAFVCETSRSISSLHSGEYVAPKEISSLKALTQDFISKERHLPEPRHAGKEHKFSGSPPVKECEEHLGDDHRVTDPPVPPPRRKRWRGPALRRSSTERAPTPGRELFDGGVEGPLTGESSLSSSSSSSEESVIELLSSMPTSPDVEVKARSSEEEDYVIFKDDLPRKDKSGSDTTVATCAKLDDCDKSTSAHSTEVVPWEEGRDPRSEKQEDESSLSLTSVDRYSEVLSRLIASDALTEVTEERARSDYPITEAVTRWLRSQSPEEVLSLPPPESESDLTDDETRGEEETQGEEKKLTGPKNVYRNPLPAPSLKDDLHPLNGGLLRGAGIRVAKQSGYTTNVDNKIGEEGRTNVPPSVDDARHVGPGSDINEEPRCDVERNMSRESSFVSDSTGEWDQWDIESTKPTVPQEGARLQSESPDDRRTYMCDPSLSVAKYYRLGAPAARKNEEGSSSETLSGSSSDEVDALRHFEYEMGDLERGSRMSLAAELARSLEPLPEHWAVDPIRSAEMFGNPEVYKKRYGDSPGGRVWLAESVDNSTRSTHTKKESIFRRQSEILVSRLKGEGPFPCGGICCILQ